MKGLAVLIWLLVAPALSRADWVLVWNDEFVGPNIDTTKWAFETGNGSGGWGNNEREYYTSRATNAYIGGGLLHIVARQESMGGFPYTSARMKSQGRFSKTYGKIEFRAKLPLGVGCWPALWMLGTNITPAGWPACGEIDIMENKGSEPNIVGGALHYSDASNNHLYQSKSYTLGTSVTNFHTYAIQWTTNSIQWLVDSNLVHSWTSWSSSTGPYPAPFNQPFFLLMNLAIGGNYLSNPTDAQINAGTPFPVEMQVDYVRVYDYVPAPPSTPTGLKAGAGSGKTYLSWNSSTSGATGYLVKRSTVSGGSYTIVGSSGTNNFTDTGVANCSSYFYVVAATNALGPSIDSTETSAALGAFAVAVNSGGNAVGQFAADGNVSGGTVATPVTTAINLSALTSAVAETVFQTERYGNFTYTFSGLTAGLSYRVRLHFAETYWTAVGQRLFNVTLNGTQVLTNFDIFAEAGAANKALARDFTVIPGGTQITAQFATVTDNAKVSGIEIALAQPAAPVGLAATAGNAQVNLKWNAVAGASYSVKRALAGGGPLTPVASGLTATNYLDAGLTNGTDYQYAVSATMLGCESTNSAAVAATPACSPPPAPVAANSGPIWAGMTLNLSASTVPGATYNWIGPGGFTSTNQNPTVVNAATDFSGVFSVTASAGGCTSTPATTSVIINPPASLGVDYQAGSMILSWPIGVLQATTNTFGPWVDLVSAASPFTNPAAAPQEFYRVRVQ